MPVIVGLSQMRAVGECDFQSCEDHFVNQMDGDLAMIDAPAWVARDTCRPFCGIVAAMIRGHRAAQRLIIETKDLRWHLTTNPA